MHELKEKYIQFCCDFYNEHAPEDKIWFGRMFDQCQEDYEQQNRCMYRWQFPLKVLKDQEATINDLKSQLNNMEACYIGVKKERDDLNEKVILQDHFYDQAAELKNSKLMINELQKRVDKAISKWIAITSIVTTPRNGLPDEFYQKLDQLHDVLTGFNEALRGEHENSN